MDPIEKLKDDISATRYGLVHLHRQSRNPGNAGPIQQELDAYVERLGLRGIGEAWRALDPGAAHRLMLNLLQHDLAYPAPLMAMAKAEALAQRVLRLAGARAQYYTNGNYDQVWRSSSATTTQQGFVWHPLTDATLGTGVVFVDDTHIGLFWVADED